MSRIATAARVAAFGAVFATATPALAANFNITMVSGHGTHLPWIRAIQEFYIPEVDKRLAAAPGKHTIKWQQAYGGTIVKLGGELAAVRQGVAEMAHVYTIFEPANLPLLQVTHVTPPAKPLSSHLRPDGGGSLGGIQQPCFTTLPLASVQTVQRAPFST